MSRRHNAWCRLANILALRYIRIGDISALKAAVRTINAALLQCSEGAYSSTLLAMRGEFEALLFDATRDSVLLDMAIGFLEASLSGIEPSSDFYASRLSSLSKVYTCRAALTASCQDMSLAVEYSQSALEWERKALNVSPNTLNLVANALRTRRNKLGDLADLDYAIELHREAVTIARKSKDFLVPSLCNLGRSLYERHRAVVDEAALDQAIQAYSEAASGDGDDPKILSALGLCLLTRFVGRSDAADLSGAIAAFRAAIAEGDKDPHLNEYKNQLAVALTLRFVNYGVLSALREAHALHRSTIESSPVGSAFLPQYERNAAAVALMLKKAHAS